MPQELIYVMWRLKDEANDCLVRSYQVEQDASNACAILNQVMAREHKRLREFEGNFDEFDIDPQLLKYDPTLHWTNLYGGRTPPRYTYGHISYSTRDT